MSDKIRIILDNWDISLHKFTLKPY